MSSIVIPAQSVTIPSQTIPLPSSGGGGSGVTQRGLDAVVDLGMDKTGNSDCSDKLKAYLTGNQCSDSELHFPPGRYYFATTVEANPKNVKLIGDGQISARGDGAVTFCTDYALDSILWFNCDVAASNLEGPWIEGIQFQDTSANHDRLRSCIRITNTANVECKVGFLNIKAQRYTAGTVTVTQGSKSVAGLGTQWSATMAKCAWIVIGGYPYEVAQVNGATSLTLAIAYQGASKSGQAYGLNWGGVGIWVDPGLGFTQYGKEWSLMGRCSCAVFASAGTATGSYTGTSRIKIKAGYLNGESTADSMAFYLGPFSDTFLLDVACNSYAFFCVIANGHQHNIGDFDCENAGSNFAPVSGMPAGANSCRGVLVMGDNSNDSYGNRISGYYRQVGTAIELYGAQGKAPTYTVLGVCTFRSNKANFVNGNATYTIGGDVYAAKMSGDKEA